MKLAGLGVAVLGCLAITASSPAHAQSAKPKLGVFQLMLSGLEPSLHNAALDAVSGAVAETKRYDVISRTELDALLGAERLKDLAGCDAVTCLAEIGGAAGVERLITGSLSLIGQTLVVSLQLVNSMYGTVENRVTIDWTGSIGDLATVLGACAELLVVPLKDRAAGTLRLAGVPAGAFVAIDGKVVDIGTGRVADLTVGVHDLKIQAEGFVALQTQFAVRADKEVFKDIALIPSPEQAFYTTWWFWLATAAVLGGSAAGAVALWGSGDTTAVHFTGRVP